MSYFIFGMLSGHDPGDRPSLDLIRGRAQQLGFNVRLNAVQPIVVEMLREQVGVFKESSIFLITAGPADDTSDGLVSPWPYDVDVICDRLARIASWCRTTLRAGAAAGVSLLITEGYDDEFERLDAEGDAWLSTLCAHVRTNFTLPTCRVDMVSDGS